MLSSAFGKVDAPETAAGVAAGGMAIRPLLRGWLMCML
jgi:hypothetical protein